MNLAGPPQGHKESAHVESVVFVWHEPAEGFPTWDEFRAAAKNALEAMAIIPTGKRVLVKANVTVPDPPDSGVITHPAFIHGVVDYLASEAGVAPENIVIAERGGEDMVPHWDSSGYLGVASASGATLANLCKDHPVYAPVPGGKVFDRLGIAASVLDPDTYVINVPKMKCHNLAITTLSMKNLMATVLPVEQRHFCSNAFSYKERPEDLKRLGMLDVEDYFANELCDLSSVVRPDLNVVEGVVGREGTGFARGKNIPARLVIAGRNAVCVDAVGSYLMGFNPLDIPYLRVAGQRGLGEINVTKIEVYRLQRGQVVPCADLESLVSVPRFEVIRGGH